MPQAVPTRLPIMISEVLMVVTVCHTAGTAPDRHSASRAIARIAAPVSAPVG